MRTLTVCFALMIGACVVACGSHATTSTKKAATKAKAKSKLPTREEFRQAYMGKTKDEILESLGRPDSTTEYSDKHHSWMYKNAKMDPISGKVDDYTRIEFLDGVVEKIS